MKTKTKLLAALSAALAATAAVATTGTFAWFTTTRTAVVNFNNTTVYNKAGNLIMNYVKVDSSTTEASQANVTSTELAPFAITGLVGSASANVTDVSGDGKTFYKPNWKPGSEGTVTSDTTATAVENSGTDHYYITFELDFENDGSKDLKLYIDNTTKLSAVTVTTANAPDGTTEQKEAWVTAQTAKNTAALKATRVAFWASTTGDIAAASLVSTWQQDTSASNETKDRFLTSDATGKAYGATADTVTGYAFTSLSANYHTDYTWKDVVKPATGTFAPDAGQLLGTVAANDGTKNGSLKVKISMWMEGTLSTCSNACIGGSVSSHFKFSALDA